MSIGNILLGHWRKTSSPQGLPFLHYSRRLSSEKHFQLCNTFLTKQFASTTSPICLACHGEEEKCIIMQYDTTSFALLGVNGAFRQASEAQVQTISGCVYLRSTIIPPTMQCLRCLKANRKWHLQIGTSYLFNFTCTLMVLLLSYWNAIRNLWQFHLWLC